MNKYFRTYIGGSKRNELHLFNKIQDVDNDFVNCDYVEYRRMLKIYTDDILIIWESWIRLIKAMSFMLPLISILLIFITKLKTVHFIPIILSIGLYILNTYLTYRKTKKEIAFNWVISSIDVEINSIYNFK